MTRGSWSSREVVGMMKKHNLFFSIIIIALNICPKNKACSASLSLIVSSKAHISEPQCVVITQQRPLVTVPHRLGQFQTIVTTLNGP